MITTNQEGKMEILAYRKDSNIQNLIDLELMNGEIIGGGLLGNFSGYFKNENPEDKIAKIDNIFMDTLGDHVIFSTTGTDNYYVNSIMTQVKPLQKLQVHLTAVAFNH